MKGSGRHRGGEPPGAADQPPADSPFLAERMLREVAHWVAERGLSTVEQLESDVAAFLAEGYQERRRHHLAEDARERAQEYAFAALETKEPEQAWQLAERALALDPFCIDAMTVLAFRDEPDNEELIERLRRILAVAEQQAAEAAHEPAAGATAAAGAASVAGAGFEAGLPPAGGPWAQVEARPRMRVMKQLAEALWDEGYRLDAVELYERLLRLDPEDRQGNDRLLLASYLAMRELGRARDVLERRRDEPEAFYAWARVLERFLAVGPQEAAAALAAAELLNPHVEPLLARRQELPAEVPATFSPGEPSEAIVCAHILGPAWAEQPEALWWLMQGGGAGPGEPGKGKGKGKSLH